MHGKVTYYVNTSSVYNHTYIHVQEYIIWKRESLLIYVHTSVYKYITTSLPAAKLEVSIAESHCFQQLGPNIKQNGYVKN